MQPECLLDPAGDDEIRRKLRPPRYPGDRGSGRSAESLHAVKGSGAWESRKRNTPPMQSPAAHGALTGFYAGNAASQAEGRAAQTFTLRYMLSQQFGQITKPTFQFQGHLH